MKLSFKLFLWYSKKIGYEVSILKDVEDSYEFYTNGKVKNINETHEKIEILNEKIDPHPSIDSGTKRNKFRTNVKVAYLDLKKIEPAGGIAILISKKVNELVNAINFINFDNQNTPE